MNPADPITRLNAALEGRYRIEPELGEGGTATVYLADDVKHERKVVVSVRLHARPPLSAPSPRVPPEERECRHQAVRRSLIAAIEDSIYW